MDNPLDPDDIHKGPAKNSRGTTPQFVDRGLAARDNVFQEISATAKRKSWRLSVES